ncbi:hypothetical protein AMECASPLE_037440 [Ameca splendens]|uniref:Uncharacterized protein n=1 Tax=Ameca splendens TaxID=208324 RepID=A0ABV0ZGP4_9TELE
MKILNQCFTSLNVDLVQHCHLVAELEHHNINQKWPKIYTDYFCGNSVVLFMISILQHRPYYPCHCPPEQKIIMLMEVKKQACTHGGLEGAGAPFPLVVAAQPC